MTDWVTWFRYQLQASADGLVWGVEQLDPTYYTLLPPAPSYLGTWQPARHLWHVTEYERCLVIPSMQQWLGGNLPPEDAWPDDDPAWQRVHNQSIDSFLAAFRLVREEQIAVLDALVSVDWTTPRTTLWGHKPLSMIVTKTFQHTYEHGDTLLRMGLWWREVAEKAAASTSTAP